MDVLKLHNRLTISCIQTPGVKYGTCLSGANFVNIIRKTNLQSLSFTASSVCVTDCVGNAISKFCRNLTRLYANQVRFGESAMSLFRGIPDITSLALIDVGLTEQGLRTVLLSCQDLEHLNIEFNPEVEGECFQSHLPDSLRHLDVSSTSCSKQAVLSDCIKMCPSLEVLNMSDLTTATSEIFIESCLHSLLTLDISLSYETYSRLTETHYIPFDFAKLPCLKNLNVSSYHFGSELGSLAQDCPNLTSLNMNNCEVVGGMYTLLVALENLNLTQLLIRDNPKWFEPSWSEMDMTIECISDFKTLEVLDLSGWNISNYHAVQLITELPVLERLELRNCLKLNYNLKLMLMQNLSSLSEELKMQPHVLEVDVTNTNIDFDSVPGLLNLQFITDNF